VQGEVARNPNTPAHILNKFSQNNLNGFREAVAQNPSTPPETLAKLADDEKERVRLAVAKNPSIGKIEVSQPQQKKSISPSM